MKVLGVDCGLAGGLALLSIEDGISQLLDAIDVPTIGLDARRRVDPHAVQNWVLQHGPELAAIERSQAYPAQGR
jgi:hypothetical protein